MTALEAFNADLHRLGSRAAVPKAQPMPARLRRFGMLEDVVEIQFLMAAANALSEISDIMSPLWGIISLRRPTSEDLHRVCISIRRADFNHDRVGGTEEPVQTQSGFPHWVVDHNRVRLGKGQDTYDKAKSQLQSWAHFRLGWADTNRPHITVNQPVVVFAKSLFLWTLNPLRIVYAKEHHKKVPTSSGTVAPVQGRCYMFAHSTLRGHQLAGEERFSVEWHTADDSVWYDQYTFSRPANPLSLLSYPLVRFYQHKFAKDSTTAIQKAIAS